MGFREGASPGILCLMTPEKEEKDSLGNLEKRLYQRDNPISYKKQGLASRQKSAAARTWQTPNSTTKPKSSSLLIRFFYFSLVFFFVTASISAYFIWVKPRFTSPDNIEILVKAPASVEGGEKTPFQVLITNNNDVQLQSTSLKIEFPEGVYVADDQDAERIRRLLGEIEPGEQVIEDVDFIFFGEENIEKELAISLEYRVEGSSATFSKEKAYPVSLTTSPVSLSVSIPQELNAREEFSIVVKATSNSKTVLEDFMIVLEYPFGFTLNESFPAATYGETIWSFGDISPGGEKEILIRGSVNGSPGEEKTFKVEAGTQDSQNDRRIGVLYNSFLETIPIQESFVALDVKLNGDGSREGISVKSGESISGTIGWVNTTDSRIQNGEILIRVNGDIVDEASITTNKGFYRSQDDLMIWNRTTDRALDVLDPQESGDVRFSFNTISLFGAGSGQFKNPEIDLQIELRGERVSPGFPSEVITVTDERTIRVSSALGLDAYALHSIGPFQNSGPIPPKAEQPTTYTIIWSVVNSSNTIRDAQVRASIPLYVTWLGNVSPGNEDITFNDLTGEVVWDIGSIASGVGVTTSAKEIAFQVSLIPSVSQVGEAPVLVSSSELTGVDTFTNVPLSDTKGSLNTFIDRDPLSTGGSKGRVTN